jgi:putative DNA primase/helicase
VTDEELAEALGRVPDERLPRARALLGELVEGLEGAADTRARVALLAGVLADPVRLELCRWARRNDSDQWAATLALLRSYRGCGDACDRLERAAAHLRIASPDDWRPSGLPAEHRTPQGYQVDGAGVWQVDVDGRLHRVARRPVYVVGYLVDVDGGGHFLRLRWQQVGGAWSEAVAPYGACVDARGVLALAGRHGLPVSSASARDLVGYLEASAASVGLPVERCAARMGWMDGGCLIGRDWLGSGEPVRLLDDLALQQLADAYGTRGTWQGWLDEVVKPGEHCPGLWLAIYAAVGSLLLHPLGVSGCYGIDWSGETSRGKTTVQRVAASVYGEPSQHGGMRSWKVSPAGLEAHATTLRHLPVILDDSKNARRAEDVASMVYMLSTGAGAVRGAPGQGARSVTQRPVGTWRSWLISSGEQRLTAFSNDAGTRARVLCLVGPPLASGDQAQRMTLGTLAHYGHLGRRCVVEVLRDLPGLRKAHRAAVERWTWKLQPHGAVAGRLGEAIAVLEVARDVAERVGLPAAPVDALTYAELAAQAGGADADQAACALRSVYAEAVRHRPSWWGKHEVRPDGSPMVPLRGWLGRWSDDARTLDVLPDVLTGILRMHGYDAGTVDRWLERGWLYGNKRTGTVRVDGQAVRCVRLTADALDVAAGVTARNAV